MNEARNFIVTTSARGASRKQIWKPEAPLKIGFPMQWVIESTQGGVRITYLGGKSGEVSRDRVREISFSELRANPCVMLDRSRHPVELRIEPASATAPVFSDSGARARGGAPGEHVLGVYRTRGNWVIEAHRAEAEFTACAGSERVFSVNAGEPVKIIPHAAGLFLIRGTERSELKQGAELRLASSEIGDAVIGWKHPSGGFSSWRFGWIAANPVALKVSRLPVLDLSHDPEIPVFKKQLRNVGLGLLALLALSLIWPRPKPQQELIPPQLAKIILTAPKHMAQASAASPAHTAAQKKVQQTAVVQAFRAQALRSAVSQLMKGGMTRLLAQSDFVEGHRNSAELGRILDTQSKDLRDTAPRIGGLSSKNLAVASLGGEGFGGKNGKAVGYGHGEHASVNGQGKAFVSMDLANSQVDDGLTKDQVGEVIHRHLSEVRYCYESAMIRTPDIEGKLVVDFVIGGNGLVKTSEAKESTLPDPRLDDCILRRLSSWKFPLPRGGVDVSVTYPFIFKTLGR